MRVLNNTEHLLSLRSCGLISVVEVNYHKWELISLWWKITEEIPPDLKKTCDISQLRSWIPSSTIKKRRASYLNVTWLDGSHIIDELPSSWDTFLFFLIVHMKPQCTLPWYLIKPYNVLLIIKHSHLVENDSAEEITNPEFRQTQHALTIIDSSLCPGVTGE